jgi:hypothetical protein
VVVGRVTQYAEPDPDCWVALESVEDPAREDPSTLETLSNGKFRLTGLAPGRYRVRVKGDESVAVYSAAFEARDGAVTDAGVLRLRKPGCIAGVLLDRDGGEVDGSVRLFGRDPATLKRRVVEVSPSVGRQGFQLAPHEAGEFALAAESEEGWALVNAKTDPDGLAWVEARLHPWSSVEAVPAPGADSPLGTRLAKITAEPVEVPDLGPRAGPVSADGGGPAPRLLPGKWKVTVLGDPGGGLPAATLLESTVTLSEGQALRLEVK